MPAELQGSLINQIQGNQNLFMLFKKNESPQKNQDTQKFKQESNSSTSSEEFEKLLPDDKKE